jgi:hypothetical protein
MMPAIRSLEVVRGGSTVPAIWIWLLHKQEVSGSWNWLLYKQEVSGWWTGCYTSRKAGRWNWLLHKQEVSGVWRSRERSST